MVKFPMNLKSHITCMGSQSPIRRINNRSESQGGIILSNVLAEFRRQFVPALIKIAKQLRRISKCRKNNITMLATKREIRLFSGFRRRH
jgi:hypothetical protein